jgi:CRISPR-associated protein (TIGR03986 family)
MPTPPYGFVPVVPKVAITDAPVFHHGANPRQETLLSGELRLTLKTLTPLLIGHDRYRAEQVNGQSPFEQGLVRLPHDWGIAFPVKKEKSIVEPLRLDGRVLIPGSALTGMLRHSLGALLSAPMERVAEHTYSYRPNIAHADPRYDQVLYASRPAVVLAVDPVLKVKVLQEARAAVFLRGGRVGGTPRDDQWVWQQLGSPSAGAPLSTTYSEVRLDGYKDVIHLIPAPPGAVQALDHRYFTYKGGMDGSGDLARLFSGAGKAYRHALVHAAHYAKGVPLDIDEAVHQRYRDTQCHLIHTTTGHLSSRHPLVKHNNQTEIDRVIAGIEASARLEVGQLIYVEVELDRTAQKLIRVTSFGHNHHYRVRYTDSVQDVWNETAYTRRAVLAPLQWETALAPPPEPGQPDHAPPAGLSAARLLFGYASSQADDSGTKGIGKGDFERLAGRLAFNMAVEQVQNPQDITRFLDNGRPIPLRVLGQPRPSAVEYYLDQTGAQGERLNTYGDLPNQRGAELQGRKDYLHQPDAATDSSLYRLDSDLAALDGCPEKAAFLQSLPGLPINAAQLSSRDIAKVLLERDAAWIKGWEDQLSKQSKDEKRQGLPPAQQTAKKILHSIPVRTFLRAIEHLQGDQAALARYVVKPGTAFRCTLRFRDLRPWELGAVLLALEPVRIGTLQTILPQTQTIRSLCAQVSAEWSNPPTAPLFAQKLGGGRPLGLGSVRIAVDRLAIWDGTTLVPPAEGHAPGQDRGVVADAFKTLGEKLKPMARDAQGAKVIESWLQVHRYQGQPRRDYPRAEDPSSGRHEIYVWHTQQRRAHAKQRRIRR